MENQKDRRESPRRSTLHALGQLIKNLLCLGLLTAPGVGAFCLLFALQILETRVSILMYRGLLLASLAIVAQVVAIKLLWRCSWLNQAYSPSSRSALIVSAGGLAFALNIAFFIVIPVTTGRSVSVFLLGQLTGSAEGISKTELRDALVTSYVDDYDAVNRRMQEQITSGNVSYQVGRFILTPQGRQFIKCSRFVGSVFGADLRYISLPSNRTPLPALRAGGTVATSHSIRTV
jgi:hypothetical protein